MPQWKVQNMVFMVAFFIISLLVFNIAGFLLGSKIQLIPFIPTNRGYSIKLMNVSIANMPIYIDAYPPCTNVSYLSVWCGEEAEVNEHKISLASRYYMSVFSLCSQLTIEIWPRHDNIGVWLHGNYSRYCLLLESLRFLFCSIIGFSFYLFFSNNKNQSVMRSILITQASCLLMLDPLHFITSYFHGFSIIHSIISSAGWWRATVELFSEYGPLVRNSNSFYRITMSVPSIFLVFISLSDKLSRFLFPNSVLYIGLVLGCALPILSLWFLENAGNTSGKMALILHVMSGSITLSAFYFMTMMKQISDEFKSSLMCETIEISFVSVYCMFYTIFHTGDTKGESTSFLTQNSVRRYDKIDELLNILGENEDEAKFEESNPDNTNRNGK